MLLPLYLRVLSAEEYGALAIILIVSHIAGLACNGGVDQAMRTHWFDYPAGGEIHRHYVSQNITSTVALSLVCGAFFILLTPELFGLLVRNDKVSGHPAFTELNFSLAILTACANRACSSFYVDLQNREQGLQYFFFKAMYFAISVALQSCFLIIFDAGISGIFVATSIASICQLFTLLTIRRDLLTWRLDLALVGASLKFSAPLVMFGLFYLLDSQLDRWMLSHYLSLRDVGIYSLLLSLFGLLNLSLNALDSTIRPGLYRLIKQNDGAGDHALPEYSTLYVAFGLWVLGAIHVLEQYLVVLTANPDFLQAADYFNLGVLIFIPLIYVRYLGLILLAQTSSLAITLWTLVKLVITGCLMTLLIPAYGLWGALWSIFIGQLVNWLAFHKVTSNSAEYFRLKSHSKLWLSFFSTIIVFPLLLDKIHWSELAWTQCIALTALFYGQLKSYFHTRLSLLPETRRLRVTRS